MYEGLPYNPGLGSIYRLLTEAMGNTMTTQGQCEPKSTQMVDGSKRLMIKPHDSTVECHESKSAKLEPKTAGSPLGQVQNKHSPVTDENKGRQVQARRGRGDQRKSKGPQLPCAFNRQPIDLTRKRIMTAVARMIASPPPPRKISPWTPPTRDIISQLPPEIKINIFHFISVHDAKRLRLMSRAWAEAGSDSLFRNGFKLHPLRRDMQRLVNVCQLPHLANRIRRLEIFLDSNNVGKFSLNNARLNEVRRRGLKRDWAYCDFGVLVSVFRKLPNLRNVAITSLIHPATGANLEERWNSAWDDLLIHGRSAFMQDDL